MYDLLKILRTKDEEININVFRPKRKRTTTQYDDYLICSDDTIELRDGYCKSRTNEIEGN